MVQLRRTTRHNPQFLVADRNYIVSNASGLALAGAPGGGARPRGVQARKRNCSTYWKIEGVETGDGLFVTALDWSKIFPNRGARMPRCTLGAGRP